MDKNYNLDDVQEYFPFKLKGFQYRFRHLNSEEAAQLQTISTEINKIPKPTPEQRAEHAKKVEDYLFSFISKVDEAAPDFLVIKEQMIVPQWKKFREMLETEFGV